ncbi:cis-3-hydroxy-L-proline dehydratase [Microvirga yunnanensis]|uniref:cis-3-hydroxy-L-proline dehydratase n=1 Tax=Microvirga yunnanensis TaxID=2953740 RepID=UPI0021C69702|nr:aconitase family protein [Microvirga sp. HBU65207]
MSYSRTLLTGDAQGSIIATDEPLSFWGGVDPATGNVIDVHHPLCGRNLTGQILFMPTSRGSCTGSGVLLDLILSGRGPAAIVFSEAEDVLTLGALIAAEMFAKLTPIVRLEPGAFARLSGARYCRISNSQLTTDAGNVILRPPATGELKLTPDDIAILEGRDGQAAQQAMKIIVAMAAQQGATTLVDVSQAHIDGCIYASPANLTFAETMADMGARVRVPSTMNAISVDMANWKTQGTPKSLGEPAARLAEAYVRMGCAPTYTCSPYLLPTAPTNGQSIAWAESNAVIFANTVIGARTAKHPDFLDLCIALTARAPRAGVYLDDNRRPQRIVEIDALDEVSDAFWPLIGYVAGRASPDRIPLLRGIEDKQPSRDDLKALCAAFGTTSASPMLHIAGVTPEASLEPAANADTVKISRLDLAQAWRQLNDGPDEVQLVAIGSPHASAKECREISDAVTKVLDGNPRSPDVAVIVTAGHHVIEEIRSNGILESLTQAQIQVIPDICWCSISEPVFPTRTRAVLTNSGKYAHYGPGLSNRHVRLGSFAECVEAAVTGRAKPRLPDWLA